MDIHDLDNYIAVATGADDLVSIFKELQTGSYRHYAMFDQNLTDAYGITAGCCTYIDSARYPDFYAAHCP